MDTSERPIGHRDIELYYASLYGDPIERRVYKTTTQSFAVLTWSPEQTGEDVFIFATVGAYASMGTTSEMCEFFFGLTSAPTGLADSLAEVALDGNGTGKIPASGDTVTLAFALWENTHAQSYLFTDGGDEIIPQFKGNGFKVDFVQLVPMFAKEVDYKKKHGEATLWSTFEDRQIAYWDADRQSAF